MSTHRLSQLLGMTVRFADGRDGDQVIDVRLTPSARVPGLLAEFVVDGLVVGRGRPGTLFGYDRHPDQGPWLIRTIVRFAHRHSGLVTWSDVEAVDWSERVVRLKTTTLRDLTPVR